ncbi:MAG: Gmad2 immunoglobulin-like domain-containing protein [Candidatus Pacebacteria bacterium]|nr:Gmad2 immunoglobulin-like domain-containing protein [Candidatus Paceibacterota bacterium]MBP9700880.1 Gmad2 immunoglobulin-like domain-containing protein [Candidatus Paceibacterota bacterium]
MKKRYIILIFILGFGFIFWLFFCGGQACAPTTGDAPLQIENVLAPEVAPAQKDDLIVVESPRPGSKVASPLVIKGKARGNWYFEASFPVTLTDAQGNIIKESFATAQGEWMTTDYVPFTTSLTYTLPIGVTNGFLILKKDNPSGEPQFDNQLSIPVTF